MTPPPHRCLICGAVETETESGRRTVITHDLAKHGEDRQREIVLPATLTRPVRVGTFGYDEE